MAGTEIRNPDGTYALGNISNPEGKNGHAQGWQKYGDRIIRLSEKYTTAQILEYAVDDVKRTTELSYWDAVCILHMARSMERRLTVTDSGADHVGKEREAMLSRIEGAPTQVFAGDKDNPLSFTLKFGSDARTDVPKADTLPQTE